VKILERINNDTLIICALAAVAMVYAFGGSGEQIVGNIVAGFVGYLGGQYEIREK
jgi:hypothetical protein